jgi:4-amino-4-deoxy-L-arabinose transferase-like glycosyltransferase
LPGKIRRRLELHPNWTLALIVLAALVPFLAKPFNMDDPLFIWAAHHIQAHPWNPYGFVVNWFGTVTPMWEATKNPPLACYFLAGAAGALGWSEVALHTALLLPAVAVILGTHRLARHFCSQPMLAAFVTLFTPAFFVSSTTVMCDVLILALWVWAVVFWVEGLGKDSFGRLLLAALLITLAALTKYYGACLVPLLAAYSLIGKRRLGRWSACLVIPITALCAYHWVTRALYGHSLLSDAAAYATFPEGLGEFFISKMGAGLTSLIFTGGCLAVAVFFAPLLWRTRVLALLAAGTALFAIALLCVGAVLKDYSPIIGTTRFFLEVQIVFWAMGGVCVLVLTVTDVYQHRDASSCLLALWVLGTFLFSAMLNWTINGRSILPMAPAVGILLVRRMEQKGWTGWKTWPRGVFVCLASGAILALMVTRADFLFAQAVRESAQQTYFKFGRDSEGFWFQGHWGFQYYMQALGASPLDESHTPLKRRDTIATPVNNTNFLPLKPELAVLRELISVPGPRFLTTMKGEVGSGFYASLRGPLPFAFGFAPPEVVIVCSFEPLIPAPRPNQP